jgi:beta-glucanase (GH16 family)
MKLNKLALYYFILSEIFDTKAQLMFYVYRDKVNAYAYDWGDEFSDRQLDGVKWQPYYGWGNTIPHNGEQQFYTKGANLYLKDGLLYITAKRQDTVGRCYDYKHDNDSLFHNGNFVGINKRLFPFTSGLIQSRRTFKYGYFETSFRLDRTDKGFWPAFWLYAGEPYEEIDWMEIKSELPDRISVNLHHGIKENVYKKKFFGIPRRFGGWIYMKNANFSKEWVTVSGIWNENEILFFVNGVLSGYYPNIIHQEKLLVANLAVAQDGWAFPPGPDKDFKDSINYIIDFIRVWQPLKDSVYRLSNSNVLNTFNENYSVTKKYKTRSEPKVFLKKKNIREPSFFVKINLNNMRVILEGNKWNSNTHLKITTKDNMAQTLFFKKGIYEYKMNAKPEELKEIELMHMNKPFRVKIN